MGSAKVYNCIKCSSVFNAAKNIMLKYICEHLMASGGPSILSAVSVDNGGFARMGPDFFVR